MLLPKGYTCPDCGNDCICHESSPAANNSLSNSSDRHSQPCSCMDCRNTQPFPGMCECCGEHPAMPDDFICTECVHDMMEDMAREDKQLICDMCHIQPALEGDVLCQMCSDKHCINSL